MKGGEKTLTKQEFDALFERCKARCLPSDQGQIQEKSGDLHRTLFPADSDISDPDGGDGVV